MEEICQYAKLLNGQMHQQIVAVVAENCDAPLRDPPQDFKQLFEDPLFLAKVRSYNSIFAFMPMGASLVDNARIDEQLAYPQESVYIFRVQENMHHAVGKLLPVESGKPSFAQLYFSIVIRKHK
jgi:hypothetical protein